MLFLLKSLPSSRQYSGGHLESTMSWVALSCNNGLQDLQILHLVAFDYYLYTLCTNIGLRHYVSWMMLYAIMFQEYPLKCSWILSIFFHLTAVLISDGVEKLQDLGTGYFFWENCIIILLQNYNLNCGITCGSKILL